MRTETINAVLEHSKKDLTLDDVAHLFEDDADLEDFIDEYDIELRMFLSKVIPEVMQRLKMRMVFANSGEEGNQ
ncbi:hypothetical protein [Salinicoccus carnicancri]|uniref:hypothetical protein n=1 Tax=Salinicoccus carnicancri TaxID=558170 RepID=UPI0002F5FC6B|nr:hypothetical protein [Salinicoccus carnicancri]